MTVIRREDGREWRIEPSAEGIPLVFGDGKYDHDPPRVASRLESALAEQLAGAVGSLESIRRMAREGYTASPANALRLIREEVERGLSTTTRGGSKTMTVVAHNDDEWTPPTGPWTEADHWHWTAEHHREFRVQAEKDRARLTEQLQGAVEECEALRAMVRGAVGFIERNPGPYDVADWLERARAAVGGQ